jgi:hypothetical protein
MMNDVDGAQSRRMKEVMGGRVLLLLFGLGVLGFLVAVDRADWFAIRPATGTSIALAHASNAAAPTIETNTATGKSINTP